ncbi:19324_t:CDS:2, partial [Cetraspora pellucida]
SEGFDTKIVVGKEPNIKEFKAHSIILLSRSAYFKNALSSRWANKENGIIIFNKPNISPLVFEVIISYIYTGKFNVTNNASLVDIFISADEIELLELCKQLKKHLLETETAWKFPKDFITLGPHHDVDLYNFALDLAQYKNVIPDLSADILRIVASGQDPNYDLLQKRISAYPFDSKIIDAKDAALIASWIDNERELPYRFEDMPFKFELIYRTSQENFSISKFHDNCDNKGPTVVIIKVLNSKEIIGRYNPLDWRSTGLMNDRCSSSNAYDDYKCKTSKSFIFSLLSFSNRALRKSRLSRISTETKQSFGNNSSQRSVSGTSKQHSYEVGIIDKDTFEIEEYEVFKITDKRFSF